VTCAISIIGGQAGSVFINKRLLKDYILAIRNIQEQFRIKEKVGIDTLIHLPGVLSLETHTIPRVRTWPHLKTLVNQALDDLVKMRQKEGRALYVYLKSRAVTLKTTLGIIQRRFKNIIEARVAKIKTDEERATFLRTTDITEEAERLAFHIRNFTSKLDKRGPIGKELDFIAQEMQREANTMGAKSCDALISSHVVDIKSQVEKIREQLQNIE
jgi:uncharacterized protein (TIGR00255 family)